MKLLSIDFAIDSLEFADRHGIFRTVRGCSLLGLEEFQARLEVLSGILEKVDGETTIACLYKRDKAFRHHCDRCLELNGVELDWLDAKCLILESLLFWHEGEAGLLVRLNSSEPAPEGAIESGKSATPYDIGAALLGMSNDLNKVLEQLNTLPAKQVGKILDARSRQVQEANDAADPEGKKKRERAEWAKKMRSKQGQAIAVPQKPLITAS
jgi:hypothetical protein